jgi:TupA-like ATPgrasp
VASTNAPFAGAPARKPVDDSSEYHGHCSRSGGWAVHLALATIRLTSHVSRRLAKFARSSRLWGWLSAIRRIYRSYHAGHGFYPSLIFPVRYTEKIQWRKLFDLNPLYAVLCDKLAVRDVVSERVGPEYLVPLLWAGGPDNIPFETLEPPYIIKSTHGTGQTLIIKDGAGLDERAVRETARAWLEQCHGTALDELGYVHVPHRLVVEKLLVRADGSPPIERKIFVFDGIAKVVQSVTVSGKDRTRLVSHHTLNWTELPWTITHPRPTVPIDPPRHFGEMIRIAERLADGLDHVRVDMYECDDKIYVGEMTLYSYSGLHPFAPDAADYVLGSYWKLRTKRLRALYAILIKRHEIRRPQM